MLGLLRNPYVCGGGGREGVWSSNFHVILTSQSLNVLFIELLGWCDCVMVADMCFVVVNDDCDTLLISVGCRWLPILLGYYCILSGDYPV